MSEQTRVDLRRTVVAWLACLLGTLVLTSVLDGTGWLIRAVCGATAIAVIGAAGRAVRVPALLVFLLQFVVGFGYVVALYASDHARGGFVPNGRTLDVMRDLLDEGFFQIETLTPPIVPGEGVSLVVVATVVIAAIGIDALAAGFGQTALAGLPLLALYVVPAAVLPDGVDFWLFLLPAFGFLLMLATDSRDRLLGWGIPIGGRVDGARTRGVGQLTRMSRNVGVAALSLSVVVPAAVPRFTDGAFGQKGIGTSEGKTISTLDPLVSMRRDLVDRSNIEIMRVRTTSARPSEIYLRAVTLDEFNGVEWKAARREVRKFDGDLPDAPGLAPRVETTPVETVVAAGANLQSDYLPMPYPASKVDVEGKWRLDDLTGNVVSYEGRGQISGQQYTVSSFDLSPKAGDVLADQAPTDAYLQPYLQLPDIPAAVTDTAKRVTGGAEGPLEIGIALQQWFRKPGNFVYDLRTTGGTGNSALLDFLRDRRGYCEHFATAMAVMARVMGVPSRINVGFTAGSLSDDGISNVITTNDAHAWPELWLPGVGWTRFEPTPGGANSNPSAPSWLPGSERPDPSQGPEEEPSTPETEPEQSETETGGAGSPPPAGGSPQGTQNGEGAGEKPDAPPCSAEQTYDAETNTCKDNTTAWWIRWKWQLMVAGLLLWLASPRLLRIAVRRRRWVLARRHGGVFAAEVAWRELRDDTFDLGWAFPAARTPRQTANDVRAAGLVSQAGGEQLAFLAGTLERSRYARDGGAVDPARLRSSVLIVRRDQAGHAKPFARVVAFALPLSLFPLLGAAFRGAFAPGFTRRTMARVRRAA
ncbi:MAG: transglutaminaseTgpA domain-containing protein [Sporichthyaceae bacterium]